MTAVQPIDDEVSHAAAAEGEDVPHVATVDEPHGPSAPLSLPREVKRRCGQHGYFFTKETCSALLLLVALFAVLVIVCGSIIVAVFSNNSDEERNAEPSVAELKENGQNLGDFRTFNPLKQTKIIPTAKSELGHVLLTGNNEEAEGNTIEANPKEGNTKLVSNMPIIQTTGGSAAGTATTTCVLPFFYKNQRYHECTSVDAAGLWCFTTTSSKGAPLWGFCECRMTMEGTSYAGTKSFTEPGRRCKYWKDIRSPYKRHLNMSEVKNYCRNPNRRPYGPWCYVNSRAWKYCDIPLCGNTMATFMGNSGGRFCHFPFVYNGQRHFNCIRRESGLYWCGTTYNYDRHRKYGFCDMRVKTHGGNATRNENRCVFPFRYGGESYASCTTVGSSKPWCITSSADDPVRRWGYCGAADTPMPKRRKCVFPFTFLGQQYVRCTTQGGHGELWCSLTDNYDRDKQYQICDDPDCLWSECDHLT